jgi:hypothetical protein
MPLYKLLKKSDTFIWTEEAQQALDSLKALPTSAPILVAHKQCEPILLYLAATTHVVSAALLVERREPGRALKVQRSVYFVSEVLSKTKAYYTQVHKLLYAMLKMTMKLQHYFTDHEVTIVTSFPFEEVVHSREATGQMSKWALKLMGYDIKYIPRTAIKSQALPDFLTWWTEAQTSTPDIAHEYWTLCRCLTGCPPGDIPKVVSFG